MSVQSSSIHHLRDNAPQLSVTQYQAAAANSVELEGWFGGHWPVAVVLAINAVGGAVEGGLFSSFAQAPATQKVEYPSVCHVLCDRRSSRVSEDASEQLNSEYSPCTAFGGIKSLLRETARDSQQ